jgi:hypothetical protein
MSVLAALALRPIMGAEETSVVRLDRQAEQEAFEGRSARSRRVAVHFSTEVRAALAYTKVPMRSTRNYSGQHVVQGITHRGLLLRVERAHGAHQSFERGGSAPPGADHCARSGPVGHE